MYLKCVSQRCHRLSLQGSAYHRSERVRRVILGALAGVGVTVERPPKMTLMSLPFLPCTCHYHCHHQQNKSPDLDLYAPQ